MNETSFQIIMDGVSALNIEGPIPGNLLGPIFVGGVERWTPEIKDDLSSDQSFYGCFEVR